MWVLVAVGIALAAIAGGVIVGLSAADARRESRAAVIGEWRAEGLVGADGTAPRLVFRDDGFVGGYDGCRQLGSSIGQDAWSVDGATVTWDGIISTMIACAGPHDELELLGTHGELDGGELAVVDAEGREVARLLRAS